MASHLNNFTKEIKKLENKLRRIQIGQMVIERQKLLFRDSISNHSGG
jgi:hypothetical protein